MISDRKYFELKGRCLIEKLTVESYGRIGVDLPNEACYLYVKEGELLVNSATVATSMGARDSIVLNCGSYFADFIKRSSKGKTEVFAIHLYPELLQKIFHFEMPSFLKTRSVKTINSKVITHSIMDRFIESLLFYFDNPDFITEEILYLKVRELILLLVQTNHATSIQELFSAIFSNKTVSAAEVVNAHIYHNLKLSELAKLSGLSVTSFKMECRRLFNEAPAKYIRNKKMERAKDLLVGSEYNISEISYLVGYRDQSHFSKSFYAAYRCSPGTYRQKHSKVNN